MDGIITKIDDNKVFVNLKINIYEKDAILAAAYKMTNFCTVLVSQGENDEVRVTFETATGDIKESLDNIARNFCNEVLDQQVRLDLEKRYKDIRKLIIEHAFSPIKDLKKALNKS